jgi:hypothetical protein
VTARGIFFDILVGIPGGCLIFMGMLMFNALLGMLLPTNPWIMLVILGVTSLIVGMMARFLRPFHAFDTALASGIIAALIILYLRSASGTEATGLVFGPAGVLVTICFCILGAWIFPFLGRANK